MRRLCIFFSTLFIIHYSLFLPSPAHAVDWNGPTAQIQRENGNTRLLINGQPTIPIFLGLNTEVDDLTNKWQLFEYQLSQAAQVGIPVISINLLNRRADFLTELFSHLDDYPQAYLIFRLYLYESPEPSELMTTLSLSGHSSPHDYYRTLSSDWIAKRQQSLQDFLIDLNHKYPNRLLGIHLEYLHTYEWFTAPAYPNSEPHFSDYSDSFSVDFCNWVQSSLQLSPCHLPTPLQRSQTSYGNVFHTAWQNDLGALVISASRFHSQRIVNAITALATTIKSVTQNKALVMACYGYLYELTAMGGITPGSGHLALQQLLSSPSIDATCAPTAYTHGRTLGQPLTPMGPMDSPALHRKLWLHEDDTRTTLCTATGSCDANSQVHGSLAGTTQILRRNLITTGLHNGTGLYFFDLPLAGWFGRPDQPAATQSIWQTIAQALDDVKKINPQGPYQPEVAVFTDDNSFALLPLLADPAANHVSADAFQTFNLQLLNSPINNLLQLGVPIRHYLLSDLTSSDFPSQNIKLAIFLNTFKIPTHLRRAIGDKLQTDGKTLLYYYADGIVGDIDAPTPDNIAALTGLPIKRGEGGLSLATNYYYDGTSGSYSASPFAVDPWFYLEPGAGIVEIGRYTNHPDQPISFAQKDFSTHRVIYSGAPDLPHALLRQIVRNSGVHFFSDNPQDLVDALGNSLMIYSVGGGTRTITLPAPADTITLSTGNHHSLIARHTTSFPLSLSPGDVAVVRWSNSTPGDLNGDSHVDLADYNQLVAGFGNPYTLADYNQLVANFGT